MQSINKARNYIEQQSDKVTSSPVIQQEGVIVEVLKDKVVEKDFIVIRNNRKIQKVLINTIVYIEGLREYVRIVCNDGQKYVALELMRDLENMLPDHNFVRVHKSYIVAKDKVTALDGNTIEMGEYKVPLSRSRRQEIVNTLFYE